MRSEHADGLAAGTTSLWYNIKAIENSDTSVTRTNKKAFIYHNVRSDYNELEKIRVGVDNQSKDEKQYIFVQH